MEALSPRSTNIQVRSKPVKSKDSVDLAGKAARARASKVVADAEAKKIKAKDFASHPAEGELVIQPPGKDGTLSVPYKMGKYLGKGGFAICHEAELLERRNRRGTKYALKIVKAKMNQSKMEEKVLLNSNRTCYRTSN